MSMAQRIQARLQAALAPIHLQLEYESHKHAVPPGSESHWKLVLVSPAFEGKRSVARQQAVYRGLAAEMKAGIHALSMRTLSPAEWQAEGWGALRHETPPCAGGSSAGG